MKSKLCLICCLGVAAWGVSPATGDNVAQPWGTIHANIGGTSASADPSLVFSPLWANGAEVAWQLNLAANSIARTPYWTSIVFDEQGNLYWRGADTNATETTPGTNAQLVSVAPDGTLRWKGNDGARGDHFLGQSSADSCVVGDGGPTGRVYALGNDATQGFVVAYSKATGAVQWVCNLPAGSNFQLATLGTYRLTPILYNGKLYIVGAYRFTPVNPPPVKVYGVDSTTGQLNWSSDISTGLGGIRANFRGQATLVPDAFGAGQHALYFNNDSGASADSKGDVYCIKINTTLPTPAASLQWWSDGGKVTRSHPIHVDMGTPALTDDRVCTHTWTDYGAEFYCWMLNGTLPVVYNNVINDGHGFYDVGCVDFNERDVLAGGFEGRVIRYRDIDVGTNGPKSDVYYQMDTWWGEPRAIGGLYQDASENSVLVSGTNSRADCVTRPPGTPGGCLGPGYTARVYAVDLTNGNELPNCHAIDDGAMYLDNLVIKGGPDAGNLSTIFSVAGFESYALGDIPTNGTNPGGQQPAGFTGWEVYHWVSSNGVPQIVVPGDIGTPGVGNRILKMDAFQGCYDDYMGAFANFGENTTDVIVTVEWDQYRVDMWDNVYMADHSSVVPWDADPLGWWSIQWDIAEAIGPRQGDDVVVPLTAGRWEHVKYLFDFSEGLEFSSTVVVTVGDANTTGFLDPFGTVPETSLRGWEWYIEGGEYSEGPAAMTAPIFQYNTGNMVDHGFTVRGGPLLGPTVGEQAEQHIYYFNPVLNDKLIALRALAGIVDCNNNGIPDPQEMAECPTEDPGCKDCNADNILDECDITAGTSIDATRPGGGGPNGVPDECEDITGPVVTDGSSWKQHGSAPGDFLRIEMGQADSNGIYEGSGGYISFGSESGDEFTRMNLTPGGSYYYGPYVDFPSLGYEPISIAGGGTLEFDARYYQGGNNVDPYYDAPIFVRVYTTNAQGVALGYRDYGIVYQTELGWQCTALPRYPSWVHITVDVDDMNGDYNCDGTPDVQDVGDLDTTRISRVLFWGTDWAGRGQDFVDVKNLEFNTDPYPNRLPIDVDASDGVECRQGGPTELLVVFNENISGVGGLSNDDVTLSSGTVQGVSATGKKLTILATGVANNIQLTVGFPGISDALGNLSIDTLTFGVLLGDSQGDMDVDLRDWAIFQDCFTGTGGGPIGVECVKADYIANGDVEQADHDVFGPAMTGP